MNRERNQTRQDNGQKQTRQRNKKKSKLNVVCLMNLSRTGSEQKRQRIKREHRTLDGRKGRRWRRRKGGSFFFSWVQGLEWKYETKKKLYVASLCCDWCVCGGFFCGLVRMLRKCEWRTAPKNTRLKYVCVDTWTVSVCLTSNRTF